MPKNIIIYFICMVYPFLLWGQSNNKDTARLKPPKLTSFWGQSRGGNIALEHVISLLDSSIEVISEKKEKLQLAKALLVYRSKDYYEDESTGTVKKRYNSYSCNFKYNDHLPENWKKFLKENMKPGDQLHFADIHVKDQNGYLFTAPDIKIIIE
jgi:hypothetical protein